MIHYILLNNFVRIHTCGATSWVGNTKEKPQAKEQNEKINWAQGHCLHFSAVITVITGISTSFPLTHNQVCKCHEERQYRVWTFLPGIWWWCTLLCRSPCLLILYLNWIDHILWLGPAEYTTTSWRRTKLCSWQTFAVCDCFHKRKEHSCSQWYLISGHHANQPIGGNCWYIKSVFKQ